MAVFSRPSSGSSTSLGRCSQFRTSAVNDFTTRTLVQLDCCFTDTLAELPLLGWHQKADILGAVLYCVLLGAYALLVIVSYWLPLPTSISDAPFFSLCNLLLLLVTGLLQRYLSWQLRKEQRQGFLKFSTLQEWIVYQPFRIVAYGSAAVLVVVALHSFQQRRGIPQALILRVVILVQIAWSGVLVSIFIWKVKGHNMSHCQPDAINSLYSALRPPSTLDDMRYVDGRGLAEQQAALLHYQQDNLQHLSKEILRLQENLRKFEGSENGTPQADLVHRLAAREQELRAITAERDQLQAEVRLARSLIEERESDILGVRCMNDKYVEENERLQAILDEWSSRTAKVGRLLELALHAERLTNMELHKNITKLRTTGDIA